MANAQPTPGVMETAMDQDRSTKAFVQGRRFVAALLIASVALAGYSWLFWP